MTSQRALRRWAFIHRWTSLICTVFLLILCVTGLPLVFHEELEALLSDDPPYAELPAGAPMADHDPMVEAARARHPDHVIWYVFADDDEPQVVVGMLPYAGAEPKLARALMFDSRTGALRKEVEPFAQRPLTFLALMLRLHTDLFADLPGELFLAGMGFLFVVAVISGVFLYAPFAGRQRFGEIRRNRSPRLEWLDLHNVLGIVLLAWMLVVGATGILNELAQPLFRIWQRTDVQASLQPYRGQPVPDAASLASVQRTYEAVQRALPGNVITSVVFPNGGVGSPYHYLVWTKGASPLTSRLFNPVLVDARTAEPTMFLQMPWYLRALELSRPLHFGDYGGMPLKVVWAVLDLVTIVVLASGLYLWLSRRRMPVEARMRELETTG
jgi:uncharacterized iron-regulated membrane protein